MKKISILFLSLFSSCSWLMTHPAIEQDLENIGKDVTKDVIKTVEDAEGIAPVTGEKNDGIK